ncbi:MAG: WxL domain-containing protein [Lactobacillaceae bacterium]|jgi:hypothetical protein|nr:WxL domain-containing protein [Lactobacillaceae bacterium]
MSKIIKQATITTLYLLATSLGLSTSVAAASIEQTSDAVISFAADENKAGQLVLESVPSFQANKQQLHKRVYTDGINFSSTKNQTLKVCDYRGTYSGWNLTVSRDEFKNGDDILQGAQFKLSEPTMTTADTKNKVPTKFAGVVVNQTATVISNVPDNSTAKRTADHSGYGESTGLYGENAAKMQLPASATPKLNVSYSATLTWKLNDVPA